MRRYDVAILGLGVMGSSAALHLAERNKSVIAFEKSPAETIEGSSRGTSRIFRQAYFEETAETGPIYTPLLSESSRAWDDLGKRNSERSGSRQPILERVGMLHMGPEDSSVVAKTIRSSSVALQRMNGTALKRYPAFDVPADWQAVLEPSAGILHADSAIRAFRTFAESAGALFRFNVAVSAIARRRDDIVVTTTDGEFCVKHVVVTLGPWITSDVLGPSIPLPPRPALVLTRQAVSWFRPNSADAARPDALPIFSIDTGNDRLAYGFPDFDGEGIKVAIHHPLGRTLSSADAKRDDWSVNDAEDVRTALGELMPILGSASHGDICVYTSAPGERFLIDRHPNDPGVIVVSPCSGHGFKFAPAIGRIIADISDGGAVPDPFSFEALARLS